MRLRVNWDALGIATSVACAIHCAFLPLFLTSIPLLGIDILSSEAFEVGMIILAFIIGAWSLSHGYRRHHHSWVPLIIFSVGFCFLIAKQVVHHQVHNHNDSHVLSGTAKSADEHNHTHGHAHDHEHDHAHDHDHSRDHASSSAHSHHHHSEVGAAHSHPETKTLEMTLLALAVLGIVTAHGVNYFKCRKAGHCHTTDCEH